MTNLNASLQESEYSYRFWKDTSFFVVMYKKDYEYPNDSRWEVFEFLDNGRLLIAKYCN